MKRTLINPPGTEGLYESWRFSQAVRVDDTVWVSGQVGVGPRGIPPVFADQARQAFENLQRVLREAGGSLADVVELLAIDLIGIVPEDEAILVAANRGRPVAFSDDSSLAARAFHNIALRLLGEDVPFLPLREQGVLEKFFSFVRSGGD